MTESEERQAPLTYQQTIANSFRDVSKPLVAYRKYREYREQQEQLTASAQDAARLSQALYQEGQNAYLDVLTSDTNYVSAELNLAIAKQNEILSLVRSTMLANERESSESCSLRGSTSLLHSHLAA
jgi:multidrug efflux system outer membrane protein